MARHPALLALLLFFSATALPAVETVDLRGYGKVSADLTPERAVFESESVEQAGVLLDKLLADLFWDGGFPVTKRDVKVGASTIAVYSVAGHGSMAIARSGRSVVALGARDENEAAALAGQEPLFLGGDVTSQPAKPHPLSLDFFDHKAFKSYIQAMRSGRGFGIESHWPFMKSIGGAVAFFGPFFHITSPAEGVFDWVASDYEVKEAERQGDMIVVGPDGGGETPLWVRNRFPDILMQPSATTLLGDWGGVGTAGGHYESWSTPVALRRQLGLGLFQRTMERYRSSPAVGGWMLFAGSPGVEYNFHGRTGHAWDASPAGQEGWRNWLRAERHWSLRDLGERWYGDPQHFSTWAEVKVPDINEFYGALGPDSFRLVDGWRWQNAPASNSAVAANPPAGAAPGWIPVAMPPSQEEAFLPRSGTNYFDATIDPSDWLKKQKAGADLWLVFGLIGTANKAVRVWWDGQPLEIPSDPDSRDGPFALRVTGLLKAGPNHLQVALDASTSQTCGGKLAGPVFLTAHEPRRSPYLGRQANARYADLIEWQSWAVTDYHRQMITLARQLDPERAYILSGGASPLFDYAAELASDYGMGVQNTGREASYRPRLSGQGLAAGFYSTSEWSATPQGPLLDRGFGWILYDADSSHCLVHDIEDFQQREKDDGWISRHRRQIQLFGKYLREQPQVALLISGETARLSGHDPFRWDIGGGDLPAAHYDNVYITEKGLKSGLAGRYPILIDTGSEFMEPDTVAAIRKYVEQGGTFVALHFTARHTALDPDSCPLARLSGFKISSQAKSGRLHFESDLPIFKGWQGKEFEGSGVAMDPVPASPANDLGAGDPPAISLARWRDGSAAVGYRRVGQGQIITLGSTFWREGKDVAGVWTRPHELERQFLERLFAECGVVRATDASGPEIWTRKMVTKNGLQNWLMALNSNPEAHDTDVWMKAESRPEEVINLETNTRTPFVFENGGISIKGLHFNPYELKTFAVRRGSLVGGLSVWWGEKTTYWKRTSAELAAAALPPPETKQVPGDSVIPIEKWRFQTDADHAISSSAAWTSIPFHDASWKIKEAGPWNYLDPELKDYHGPGLYRGKVNVPPAWDQRRVLLNLYDFDIPIVYDAGDFSINGTKVASYKAHRWSQTYNYDVTGLIHPGENVLAVETIGGPKAGGLGGSIWIEAQPPLQPSLDLRGRLKSNVDRRVYNYYNLYFFDHFVWKAWDANSRTLLQQPHRFRMEADRTPASIAETLRTTSALSQARHPRRPLLRGAHGLRLAPASPRSAALAHRLFLLHDLAARRNLADNSRLPARSRSAAERKKKAPTAAIIDSQSVKTSNHGGVRGYDAGKKVMGRKRHLLVDTLGLILHVVVHPASIQDRDGAKLVLSVLLKRFGWLRCIFADSGYAGELVSWCKRLLPHRGVRLEIVKRSDADQHRFIILRKRWIVERTFGWLSKSRRLSKDYEYRTDNSEAMILIAATRLMIARLA